MSLPALQFGCDPELAVRSKATGEFVSAWGLIPGDKKKPYPVPGGAIQVDGMAVEFNIDPVSTLDEWNFKINQVRGELERAVGPAYELVAVPTVNFDPAYWATLPDASKVLGCDPDLCAWNGQVNVKPDGNAPVRGLAGHVHIGWYPVGHYREVNDLDHIQDCIEVVKQLDAILGIATLTWDNDKIRRRHYGQAGNFRVKPYGVEYRTPSNAWLNSPATQSFVFNAAKLAIEKLHQGVAIRNSLKHLRPNYYINATTRDRWSGNYLTLQHINNLVNTVPELGPMGLVDLFTENEKQYLPKPRVDLIKMDVLRELGPFNIADDARKDIGVAPGVFALEAVRWVGQNRRIVGD